MDKSAIPGPAKPMSQSQYDEYFKSIKTVKLSPEGTPEYRSPAKEPANVYFQQLLLLNQGQDSVLEPAQGYMPQILKQDLALSGYAYNMIPPTTSEFVKFLVETYTTAHRQRYVAPTGTTIDTLLSGLPKLYEEGSYRLFMSLANSYYAPYIQVNPTAFLRSGLIAHGEHLYCAQCDIGFKDSLDPNLWPGFHTYMSVQSCTLRPSLHGNFEFRGGSMITLEKNFIHDHDQELKDTANTLSHGLSSHVFSEAFKLQQRFLPKEKAHYFNTKAEKDYWVKQMYTIFSAMMVDMKNISMAPETPIVKTFQEELKQAAQLASAGIRQVIPHNARVMGNIVPEVDQELLQMKLQAVGIKAMTDAVKEASKEEQSKRGSDPLGLNHFLL